MKNYLHAGALLLCTALLLSACDSALDLNPLDQVSDVALWEDEALIDAYLADIYLGMRHGLYEVQLGSMVDESHFIHGYGTNEIVQSIFTPSNLAAWNGAGNSPIDAYRWGAVYSRVRQVNILLANIDDAAVEDEALRNNIKGEAHFLRAYYYHNLLRAYGGVPIITEVYALDDELAVARNTFAETVDFIVQEADQAAALLPEDPRNLGRATRGAALALKARVLLHAASDLFNENPANELVGYQGGDRTARWRAAQEAARAVMDMGKYSLYNRQPDDPAANYAQLFLENDDHEEIIMSRFFLEERGDGYNPGLHNGPNGYRNWAGNTPIQQLVDDYEMIDGTAFDWGNPEHAASPYENRDPRFHASILYDGAFFRPRPPEGAEIEPVGIIQTFERVTLPNGNTVPGLDTRDGPIEDWNGGYSGYYLRKFIDPSINHSTSSKQTVPWRFFRYAEVLLNYAEASIELGDEGEARRVLNMIRARAGMPDITDTGDALRQRYRNERRVELVFEEHRYWDVRRWMIAPEVYENAQGIRITAQATDPKDRSTYSNYQYEPIHIQDRGWHDRAYFVPIPFAEIQRNDQLVQNPLY